MVLIKLYIILLLTTKLNNYKIIIVKESGSMVNIASKFLAERPTRGGLFNHTIVLNNKENTKFLDLFVV